MRQTLLDRHKQAAAAADLISGPAHFSQKALHGDAMRDIARMAMMTLGAGAAARGGMGLANVLSRGVRKKPHGLRPLTVTMPGYPREEEPEKQAFLGFGQGGATVAGSPVTNKRGLYYYMPAMAAAGIGGGMAGWKGVDAMLDARRRAESEDEVANARRQFEEALSYTPQAKQASDTPPSELAVELDALYDDFQKTASMPTMGDVLGAGAGGYLTYAGLAALMAGTGVYGAAKKHQHSAVLDKALQRRRQEQQDRRPIQMAPPPAMPRPTKGPSEIRPTTDTEAAAPEDE